MPAMLVTGDPCATKNVLVSLHNNPNHARYNIVNALICTVFSVCLAGNKENRQLLHVFLVTINGKRISINWADCVFTFYLQNSLAHMMINVRLFLTTDDKCMVILSNIVCHNQTVAPLSHSSLVPRPPLFLPSICVHINTRMWSSAPVYYCLWVQMEGKKGGGLGTRLVTHYIQAFVFVLCCSLFSLS